MAEQKIDVGIEADVSPFEEAIAHLTSQVAMLAKTMANLVKETGSGLADGFEIAGQSAQVYNKTIRGLTSMVGTLESQIKSANRAASELGALQIRGGDSPAQMRLRLATLRKDAAERLKTISDIETTETRVGQEAHKNRLAAMRDNQAVSREQMIVEDRKTRAVEARLRSYATRSLALDTRAAATGEDFSDRQERVRVAGRGVRATMESGLPEEEVRQSRIALGVELNAYRAEIATAEKLRRTPLGDPRATVDAAWAQHQASIAARENAERALEKKITKTLETEVGTRGKILETALKKREEAEKEAAKTQTARIKGLTNLQIGEYARQRQAVEARLRSYANRSLTLDTRAAATGEDFSDRQERVRVAARGVRATMESGGPEGEIRQARIALGVELNAYRAEISTAEKLRRAPLGDPKATVDAAWEQHQASIAVRENAERALEKKITKTLETEVKTQGQIREEALKKWEATEKEAAENQTARIEHATKVQLEQYARQKQAAEDLRAEIKAADEAALVRQKRALDLVNNDLGSYDKRVLKLDAKAGGTQGNYENRQGRIADASGVLRAGLEGNAPAAEVRNARIQLEKEINAYQEDIAKAQKLERGPTVHGKTVGESLSHILNPAGLAQAAGYTLAYSVMGGAIYGVISGIKELTSFTVAYMDNLTRLEIVSKSGAAGLHDIDSAIKSVSNHSAFSINELAGVSEQLLKAGVSAKQLEPALAAIARGAEASGADIKQMADIATSSVKVWGLPFSEVGHVTNVMTNAVNNSKLSLQELGQDLAQVGEIAEAQNLSFSHMTATLATLADAGVRNGAMGLKQLLVSMAEPTKKLQDELHRVGLTVSDINVPFLGLDEVMRRLNAKNFNPFAAFSARGANTIVSLKAHSSELKVMEAAVNDNTQANYAAEKAAGTLSNEWKNLTNQASTGVVGALQSILNGLRGVKDETEILTAASKVNREGLDAYQKIGTAYTDQLKNQQNAMAIMADRTRDAAKALDDQRQKTDELQKALGDLEGKQSLLLGNEGLLSETTHDLERKFAGLAERLKGLPATYDNVTRAVRSLIKAQQDKQLVEAQGLITAARAAQGVARGSYESSSQSGRDFVPNLALKNLAMKDPRFRKLLQLNSENISDDIGDRIEQRQLLEEMTSKYGGDIKLDGRAPMLGVRAGAARDANTTGGIKALLSTILTRINAKDQYFSNEADLNEGVRTRDQTKFQKHYQDLNERITAVVAAKDRAVQGATDQNRATRIPLLNQTIADSQKTLGDIDKQMAAAVGKGAQDYLASLKEQLHNVIREATNEKNPRKDELAQDRKGARARAAAERKYLGDEAFVDSAAMVTTRKIAGEKVKDVGVKDETNGEVETAIKEAQAAIDAYAKAFRAQVEAEIKRRKMTPAENAKFRDKRKADLEVELEKSKTALEAAEATALKAEIKEIDKRYIIAIKGAEDGVKSAKKFEEGLKLSLEAGQKIPKYVMDQAVDAVRAAQKVLEKVAGPAEIARQAALLELKLKPGSVDAEGKPIDELTKAIDKSDTAVEGHQATSDALNRKPDTLKTAFNSASDHWKKTNNEFKTLQETLVHGMGDAVDHVGEKFSTMFTGILMGTTSVKSGLRSMLMSVTQMFEEMALKFIANQVFAQLLSVLGAAAGSSAGSGSAAWDASASMPGVTTAFNGGLIGSPNIPRFADGGQVMNGATNRDSVLAMLAKGEFVLNKKAVDSLGPGFVAKLNSQGKGAMQNAGKPTIIAPSAEQHMSVYVMAPNQKPQLGPNDILHVISEDILSGGTTKQLIRHVSQGG